MPHGCDQCEARSAPHFERCDRLDHGPIFARQQIITGNRSNLLLNRESPRLSIVAIVALIVFSAIGIVWMMFLGGTQLVTDAVTDIANRQAIGEHSGLLLALFFALAVLTQLLVVPSGSLMLVAAGFVFGAPSAALVYAVAQALTAWPVYTIASRALRRGESTLWSSHVDSAAIRPLLTSIESLRQDSFLATVTLRLTPVVPSAVACVLAATLGLRARSFLLGTLASCWVRPLFFASAGAGLRSAGQLSEKGYVFSLTDVMPLLLLFVAALSTLVIRRLLKRKSMQTDIKSAG